jgi:hypothetical protein
MKLTIHPDAMQRWKLAACFGKERYEDGNKAARVLSHMRTSGGRNKPMTYRCPHCGGWHIGRRS